MAQQQGSQENSNSRKWFDFHTVRGWVETAGAAVAVFAAGVTVYLQLFPGNPPEQKAAPQPASVNISGQVTQSGSGNVIGSGNTVTIQITGYTVEQHEERLKRREAELRTEFERTSKKKTAAKVAAESELAAVRAKLADLQQSHKARVADLKRIATELQQFKSAVPEDKTKLAMAALSKGESGLADGVFAEVEAAEQRSIERAAKAAFERGRIAFADVRWQDALAHFEKAARLQPDNMEYSLEAALLAEELGDYESAGKRYESILEHQRKATGEETAQTAAAMKNLASLRERQGHYSEAEPLIKAANAINEKILPADHLDLAGDYILLAEIYRMQARYGEAEPLL